MNWIKQGKIFSVNKNFGWMCSHAQIPTILVLKDRLRVYFSTRKIKTESKIAFVDLDLNDPKKIIYLHKKPILSKGKKGTFDENGVMPSCVIKRKKKIFLYYSGWSRSSAYPYTNLTGLAISEDNGITFKKIKNNPILNITDKEQYSATSPFVILEKGVFHMFYCSGTNWIRIKNNLEHTYNIKHCISTNGINFNQTGEIAIKTKDKFEAITRPVIIKNKKHFHMFFCHRGSKDFRDGKNSYKIGYAFSPNLKKWFRKDKKVGIDLSDTGWDSKMLAYPYLIKTVNGICMFYNGNGFGQTGFGYAILKENKINV